MNGKMHSATIKGSKRLQRILEILSDGKLHTTIELAGSGKDMAPGTSVSELRKNGYNIECKYVGETNDRRKVYTYQWIPRGDTELVAA